MANTTSLFPILDQELEQPRLSPLARAAAEAPLHSSGHLTEYRPLATRSLLAKTSSKRGLPFTHVINPYRGCEFACRYCYARYTHEFMEKTPEEFERTIYFKQSAPWLLRQELARLKPGTEIAIGTATDPYQPLERRERLTRSILEVFAGTSGFSIGLVTKSALILRDLDLLRNVARRHSLTLHLTITTTDTKLARILEPRAPRPDLRFHALARLRQAGLRAGVFCSPLMPGITDSRANIDAVAREAAAAHASFFAANPLFLKPCSLPTFFKFVEEHFPEQLEAYRRRYGTSAFVSPEYRKRIAELVSEIRREHKLSSRLDGMIEEKRAFAERPASADTTAGMELQPWLPFSA